MGWDTCRSSKRRIQLKGTAHSGVGDQHQLIRAAVLSQLGHPDQLLWRTTFCAEYLTPEDKDGSSVHCMVGLTPVRLGL